MVRLVPLPRVTELVLTPAFFLAGASHGFAPWVRWARWVGVHHVPPISPMPPVSPMPLICTMPLI